jgi:hypothetical protein
MARRCARLLALVLLLAGLAVASPTATPTAGADYKPYGRAMAPDQTLKRGCRNYKLSWVLKPPSDEWSAIITVYTPKGRKAAGILLDANAPDPLRGSRWFKLCRASVIPGRYKVGMLVIWNEGRDRFQAPVAPTYFRMRLPR